MLMYYSHKTNTNDESQTSNGMLLNTSSYGSSSVWTAIPALLVMFIMAWMV